ncbi:MAG: LysE family transporter [Candidatus Bipolaricaulia bacterium]
MPLFGLFLTSFVVGLSGALMPGPLFVATVKGTYLYGPFAGPLVTLGHGLIELVAVLMLALGLGQFVSSALVMAIVGLAGGLALVFLGSGMIRDVLRGRLALAGRSGGDDGEGRGRFGPIISGLVASVVNPYWVTWWLTIGASYVLLSLKQGWLGLPLFYTGHILSDLVWLTLVSITLSQGKRLIGERLYTDLIFSCGLFLIALAGWFIYSGLRALALS